ncbi:MAG: carboxypeptidase regulatory-like domain-containing protein, partial [Gemmatimonadales bacterium]|nr:carboxypeptidase regulatory-like domain-containing protein [Gemmatimonadales bacterium]
MRIDSVLCRIIALQAVACGWMAVPALLHAQLVRGELVDSIAGRPVAAAIVTLVDTAGDEHGRTLTDATGRFAVRAPGAGDFRLRARIVGFDVWE